MQHRSLMPAALICVTALGAFAACGGVRPRQPAYSISVQGAGNQVTATSKGPEVVFEVRSDTGLGSASVEQTAGDAPAKVEIRLALSGLEEFKFEYDNITVTVSVSSHSDQAVSESMRKPGSEETIIAPDSPYWMPVRSVGSPTSGAQNSIRTFEVQAPQDFIQGQHRAFRFEWIDFYR